MSHTSKPEPCTWCRPTAAMAWCSQPPKAMTSRTALPNSSPRRRWAARADTGGHQTVATLLVSRVDVARVRRWYIADPANPERPPVAVAYPAAGTDNAEVTLQLVAPRRRASGGGCDGIEPASSTWSTVELVGARACSSLCRAAINERCASSRWTRRPARPPSSARTPMTTGSTSSVACRRDLRTAHSSGPSIATERSGSSSAKRLVTGNGSPGARCRRCRRRRGHLQGVGNADRGRRVHVVSRRRRHRMRPRRSLPGVWRARRAGGTTVLATRDLEARRRPVSIHRDGRQVGDDRVVRRDARDLAQRAPGRHSASAISRPRSSFRKDTKPEAASCPCSSTRTVDPPTSVSCRRRAGFSSRNGSRIRDSRC